MENQTSADINEAQNKITTESDYITAVLCTHNTYQLPLCVEMEGHSSKKKEVRKQKVQYSMPK